MSENRERLVVKDLAGSREILAGALAGQRVLGEFISATPQTRNWCLMILDFQGVVVATSSFLRESVVAYRDFARTARPSVYPVLANLSEAVEEELHFFLERRADAFWACDLDAQGQVGNPRLVGKLDLVLRETLDAVAKLGSVSAPLLTSLEPEKGIGPTAWNNRLQGLHSRGLVVERRSGRTKHYNAVLETVGGC